MAYLIILSSTLVQQTGIQERKSVVKNTYHMFLMLKSEI